MNSLCAWVYLAHNEKNSTAFAMLTGFFNIYPSENQSLHVQWVYNKKILSFQGKHMCELI